MLYFALASILDDIGKTTFAYDFFLCFVSGIKKKLLSKVFIYFLKYLQGKKMILNSAK